MASPKKFETIDEYIAEFPEDIRDILEKMRKVIQDAAPDAEEAISYGMPTLSSMVTWCILRPIKTILGFIPHHQGLRRLKRKFQDIKVLKVPCNSPWTNQSPMNW